MKRILYIHSNIVAISVYQTVKDALAQNDKVIIVTNRNCKWPFFIDRVTVYDFAEMFYGANKQRTSLSDLKAIKRYIEYQIYIGQINKVISRIVDGEDFLFYLPSMALDMPAAFAYNKHCKGHYYVDEGSIAYLPKEVHSPQEFYFPEDLAGHGIISRTKLALKRFLRLEDHCHYEIYHPLFKGTISITQEAFPWNKTHEKIINPIDECVNELQKGLSSFDDVIITAELTEDINTITQSIDYTIAYILRDKQNSRIGIKLHPNAVTYNKEKTLKVLQYISDKYANCITIIPKEVSIEVMSLVYHPRLYSLFVLSSLILYGLLFKSSKGFIIKNDNNSVTIEQVGTVDEYYRMTGSLINIR